MLSFDNWDLAVILAKAILDKSKDNNNHVSFEQKRKMVSTNKKYDRMPTKSETKKFIDETKEFMSKNNLSYVALETLVHGKPSGVVSRWMRGETKPIASSIKKFRDEFQKISN